MSRDVRPTRLITAAALFGGCLEKHGVREEIVPAKDAHEWAAEMDYTLPPNAKGTIPGTTKNYRFLTDGSNYIRVNVNDRGFMTIIESPYGQNDCNNILRAIATEFDLDFIDEDHPSFWEDFEGEVLANSMSFSIVIETGADP